MCRNLLIKYGVNCFQPRTEIDCYGESLYQSVKVNSLSASVDVKELSDSTFHALHSSETLENSLDLSECLFFDVIAGLDGSGSHKKRQHSSGDSNDDYSMSTSENFL